MFTIACGIAILLGLKYCNTWKQYFFAPQHAIARAIARPSVRHSVWGVIKHRTGHTGLTGPKYKSFYMDHSVLTGRWSARSDAVSGRLEQLAEQ